MSGAEFAASLNRRHKVALCATLICVGLILILSHADFRQTMGILFLGLAFGWALGSNYRAVHWVFVVLGVLLLTPAASDVWNIPTLIQSQTIVIEGDKDAIKTIQANIHPGESERAFNENLRELDEALAKDLHDEMELNFMERSKYLFALESEWRTDLGGLLLLSAGIGLLFGIKATTLPQEVPTRPTLGNTP